MEVTKAEKTQLEKAREAWERPPQWFIDLWNEACYGGRDHYWGDALHDWVSWGKYNDETGYFELNTITDITYKEARLIMDYGHPDMNELGVYCGARVRTHLPFRSSHSNTAGSYNYNRYFQAFAYSRIEVLNVCPPANMFCPLPIGFTIYNSVFSARYLRKVIGRISLGTQWQGHALTSLFWDIISNLEHVTLQLAFAGDFDMSGRPAEKLDLESWQKLVELKVSGTCSIKVPSNVYAKLTGTDTALTEEEAAQWQSLVPIAAEKGITFTT